ncbi:MAG: rRNA pseudouridine synthase [Oscillospiraceae bacterium]|nr:rRNA pseudouridine synthase [Oscillospiraceae bacterium]
MRLQKYLAHAGVASRRHAEEMIKRGRVRVNGEVVTEMGVQINPDAPEVEVDGKPVYSTNKKIYIVLNKPVGYITTVSDDRGRKTVMDLVSDIPHRIYPVGRLDYDTEGLLFMTNDGDFTYTLTHPKHNVEKTYIAHVSGNVTMEIIESLRNGIELEGQRTSPAKVEIKGATQYGTKIEITIHEGKNRQVRNMFEAVGLSVNKLRRTQEGGVAVGKIALGKWRQLSESEVNLLKKGGIKRDKTNTSRTKRAGWAKAKPKTVAKRRRS